MGDGSARDDVAPSPHPRLLAVADLHVRHSENRLIAERIAPGHPQDWLLVVGDVDEQLRSVIDMLGELRSRFEKVIWVPGNHELWSRAKNARADPDDALRGAHRYDELVRRCRAIDVLTPEDEFPVWRGPGGPITIAPLFLLYDYSFLPAGTGTVEQGLDAAHRAGVVCTDEFLLHPDPYPSRIAWCRERVRESARRLDATDPDLPTVLVNHWPLTRTPTDPLWYPEFALWCGTTATRDWHLRYRARAVVHGHLHIPRTIDEDGVPFVEASLGYPREWRRHSERIGGHFPDLLPRQILPLPPG